MSQPMRLRPTLETCEHRFLLSAGPGPLATGPAAGTLAVLQAYTRSFLATRNEPLYNPALDLNHNGKVGQVDGRLLLHRLPPLAPPRPVVIQLRLAPQDAAAGPTSMNSGGKTHLQDVTILGRTTPGALVFTDGPKGDYKFVGPALTTNARGDFAIKVHLKEGLNNFDFLAVDHYGRQRIQDYPIFWVDFAAEHSHLK